MDAGEEALASDRRTKEVRGWKAEGAGGVTHFTESPTEALQALVQLENL